MSGPPPSARALEAHLDARMLRRIAMALVAYGAFGLVTLALIAFVGARSFGSIAPLSDQLESGRRQLASTMRQTSIAIRDAGTGTVNAGQSLDRAQASARQAATLSRSLAVTMSGLAAASDISIFGQKPFGSLGGGFGDAATQANQMASSLDEVAGALATNGRDVTRVKTDFDQLAGQVDVLAAQIESAGPFASATTGADALRWVFLVLAAWLAVPALAALAGGIALWRWLLAHEGAGQAGLERPARRHSGVRRGPLAWQRRRRSRTAPDAPNPNADWE